MLLVYHATAFADYPWIAVLFVCCVMAGAIWDYRKGELTHLIRVGREIEIEIEGDHMWIDTGRVDYGHSDGAFESYGMLHLNGDRRDGPWTLIPSEALTQDQRMRLIGLLCARYGTDKCKIPERPHVWKSLLTDFLLIALLIATTWVGLR